ncbi:MAG TPA: type II 3-dehydroquinate dehydratase [Acidimicrobiales bacterium]|nr:type II 3-dehydroquinate dehydratase [Acidimicrobiales bacterium]
MTNQILLLSGPNLDQLGTRSPEIYGTATLGEHVARFTGLAAAAGFDVTHVQSNFEGDLIETVHAATGNFVAIVINAGALTHSSWSLRDALNSFDGVKVEIHLSNPAAREPFRHLSTLASVVDGSIAGFGAASYDLGVDAVVRLCRAR